MPTPQEIVALYDFESAIETAVRTVFVNPTISGLVPERVFDRASTPANFEEIRPRLELYFMPGQELETWQTLPTGRRNKSWSGQLDVVVVSKYHLTGQGHRAYVAQVRHVCANLVQHLNNLNALTKHTVNQVVGTGNVPVIADEQGYELNTLSYRVHFNIRSDAWPSDL